MAEEKPKYVRVNSTFSFSVTPELKERLTALAEYEERSYGYIARRALIEHLEKKGF